MDFFKTVGLQQIAYGFGLIITVFEHQPATRVQVIRCLGDDQTQVVEPVDTRYQRAGRFETHIAFHQMRIG
ncbi:hypothetical protein FQZ97_1113700 [compost metagenome]